MHESFSVDRGGTMIISDTTNAFVAQFLAMFFGGLQSERGFMDLFSDDLIMIIHSD